MKNLTIENKGNQLILTINKEGFDESYLINLLKRLQIEELAQKAEFDQSISEVADEINQEWWEENGEQFLKGIKK